MKPAILQRLQFKPPMRIFPLFDYWGASILIALYLLLALLEALRPLRARVQRRSERLPAIGALAFSGFAVLRLALIPAVVTVAAWGQARGFGLVRVLPLPNFGRAVLAFMLLDYSMYGWHWLNHRVPLFWRFHHVHHTDLDLDVFTAARFHFGEIAFSVAVRAAQVALIGVGPVLALAYEIALEAETQFHHSNWRLPIRLERMLNWLIVTPRMHGIHHSIVRRSMDSNFSNIFSCWDRLHGTVRLNVPQKAIVIGVPDCRDPMRLTAVKLLAMPFVAQAGRGLADAEDVQVGDNPRQLAE